MKKNRKLKEKIFNGFARIIEMATINLITFVILLEKSFNLEGRLGKRLYDSATKFYVLEALHGNLKKKLESTFE